MNVLVSCFSGSGNIGDESILEGLKLGFENNGIDVNITVLTLNPEKASDYHQDVDFIRRPDLGPGILSINFQKMVEAYRRADLVIVGGGGLIQDAHTLVTIPRYLHSILLGNIFGAKTAIFGSGVGPVKNSLSSYFLKKTVDYCDYIMVRDEYSLQYLEQIGVKKGVLAGDLAYCLEAVESTTNDENKLIVGLSARDFNFTEESFKEIAEACQILIDDWNAKIHFIPFGESGEITDEEVGELIKSNIKCKRRFSIFPASDSVGKQLQYVASCDIIIAGRLHAAILASLHQIPAIGLSYLPKIKREMESLGYCDIYYINQTSSINRNEIVNKCDKVLNTRDEIEHQLTNTVQSKRLAIQGAYKQLLLCNRSQPSAIKTSVDLLILSIVYLLLFLLNIVDIISID